MIKKVLALVVVFVMVLSMSLAAFAETFTAPKATPKIDGSVDAVWANATATDFTFISADNACSGTVKALWDDKNVYFLFNMKDATPSSSGANENKDSVELWFSFNGNSGDGYSEAGDGHIRVAIDGEVTSNFAGIDWVKAKAAKQVTGGYIVELAVQWQGNAAPAVGGAIKFTASANDDNNGDGTRDAYIGTNANPYWAGTANIGTLTLAAAPEGAATDAASNPKTGDTESILIFSSLAVVALGFAAYLVKHSHKGNAQA